MKKEHVFRVAMSFPMIRHNEQNQKELELFINETLEVNREQSVVSSILTKTLINIILSSLYVGCFLGGASIQADAISQFIILFTGLFPIYFIVARFMHSHAAWIAFKEEIDYKLYRWEKSLKYVRNNAKNTIMQLAIASAFFALTTFIFFTLTNSVIWVLLFTVGLFGFTSYLEVKSHLLGAAIANYCSLKD